MAAHDAALLTAIYYSPIVWGAFNAGGQAFAAALVALAALAAVIAFWAQGRGPAVIPNALHLPALLFLALSALSAVLVSVSPHASAIELARLAIGAALFWLVANRALLPAARPRTVAALFACSLVVALFVRVPSESNPGLRMLTDPDLFREILHGAGASLRLFSAIGVLIVAALVAANGKRPSPTAWWTAALVVSAAFVLAPYGLREKLLTYTLLKNPTWPIFSTFFNPNPLGGFLAMACLLALGTVLAAQGWWRRSLWLVAGALVLAAIVPTYSKGAELALLIAALVSVALLAGATANRRRNLRVLGAALGLAALAAALSLILPATRPRLLAAFGGQSASNMFRILTWEGTARMALDHPLLGVGPGGFKYAFMQYAVAGYTEAAHQNYLHVAAEQGFIGLSLFLWLIGAALFTTRRALKRAGSLRDRMLVIAPAASLVVLLAHSFLDYDLYIGAIGLSFWLILGLLAHHAHGGEVEAPTPSPEPASRSRRRPPRPAPGPAAQTGLPAHRLPWPRAAAGRVILFAAFALVLAWCFWTPLRNALADSALREGLQAYARVARAAAQGDNLGMQQYADMALASYLRATQHDPGWARAWEHYGLLLGRMGEIKEGEEAVKHAAALEPTSFQPWMSLAALYSTSGQPREAVAAYQQALARYRDNTRALRRLAQVYQQLGEGDRALTIYHRMAEIEQSPYARYRALGDIDVDTEYAFAHYELGRAAFQGYASGERPDALPVAAHEFDETLRVVAAYQEKGRKTDQLFQQVGQPREDRASEMEVLAAKTRWRLGEAYRHMGHARAAQREREQALRLYPEVERAIAAEEGGNS